MKYVFENKVEFYITNVCNLTCENCNRFNNHRFTGWQRWSDYEPAYRQWAQVIDLKHIVIIGGEPLLNPSLLDWIQGLDEIFGSSIQILSNGLRLGSVRGLYETMLNAKNCHVGISLHNLNHFDEIRQNIKEFLDPDIIDEHGDGIGRSENDGIYYSVRDKNNMLVNVYLSNSFSQSSVIVRPNGSYTLHQSDPEYAHKNCGFARYKCYHFIRGKLYKCGPVALMPEFDQQFNLDISQQDRELLNSYRPLAPEEWAQRGQLFMDEIDNPIPQCRFCPQTAVNKTIFPVVKSSADAK